MEKVLQMLVKNSWWKPGVGSVQKLGSFVFAQPKDVDDVDKDGSVAKLLPPGANETRNPVLPPKWLYGPWRWRDGALP